MERTLPRLAAHPRAAALAISLLAHATLVGLAAGGALARTPAPGPGAPRPIPVVLLRAEPASAAGPPAVASPPVPASPPAVPEPPAVPAAVRDALRERRSPRPPARSAGAPAPTPPSVEALPSPPAAGPAGGAPAAAPDGPAAPSVAAAAGAPPSATLLPRGGYQVRPRYPAAARREGAEGTAYVRVLVAPSGRVERAGIDASSGHDVLDRAALDAVRRWRFEPLALPPGTPGVWARIPVSFRLHESGGGSP